jgi:hypothetical protein
MKGTPHLHLNLTRVCDHIIIDLFIRIMRLCRSSCSMNQPDLAVILPVPLHGRPPAALLGQVAEAPSEAPAHKAPHHILDPHGRLP